MNCNTLQKVSDELSIVTPMSVVAIAGKTLASTICRVLQSETFLKVVGTLPALSLGMKTQPTRTFKIISLGLATYLAEVTIEFNGKSIVARFGQEDDKQIKYLDTRSKISGDVVDDIWIDEQTKCRKDIAKHINRKSKRSIIEQITSKRYK